MNRLLTILMYVLHPDSFGRRLHKARTCFRIPELSCSVYEEGNFLQHYAVDISPHRAPMNYLVLDLSKKSYTTVMELCCRNRILFKELLVQKKKGNKSRRHSWFSKCTYTALTFIIIQGLCGKNASMFSLHKTVFVCYVHWLAGFLPNPLLCCLLY